VSTHPPLQPGVWAILPTPFNDDLSIDHESLERVTRFFIDKGSTGVVALGVNGEAHKLSAREQQDALATVASAAGDTPLVVGISELTTARAVEQAEQLSAVAGDGLAAVMAKVPSPDAQATSEHVKAVSAAAGTGVVVQDYPELSGIHITPKALADASESSGVAAAIKAETPPSAAQVATLREHTDLPIFGGLGGVGLLDELHAGSSGAMTGFSYPEGLWAVIDAYRSEGFAAARAAYAPWLPLVNFEGQLKIGLAVRKEVLVLRGAIAGAAIRPPSPAMPENLRDALQRHVEAAPLD
jgi:4-hydroxy-tetrahydrodipicolinate synthase